MATAEPDSASYALGLADESFRWYKQAAIRSRRWYRTSETLLLLTTAAIPVAGLLWPNHALVPAVLGSVAVVIAGMRAIFHWHENYLRFSRAREAIEAERRLFRTESHPYNDPATREQKMVKAVSRVEQDEMNGWIRIVEEQPRSTQTDSGPRQ